jgi:hypothetical protein
MLRYKNACRYQNTYGIDLFNQDGCVSVFHKWKIISCTLFV